MSIPSDDPVLYMADGGQVPDPYIDLPDDTPKPEGPQPQPTNPGAPNAPAAPPVPQSQPAGQAPPSYNQQYVPPQQYVPQTQVGPSSADLHAKVNEQFFRDPASVLLEMQRNADAAAARRFLPVAAMAVRNQADSYINGANLEEPVANEYRRMVADIPDEQLAGIDNATLRGHLANMRDLAVGRAVARGWVPEAARRAAFPNYGGPGSAPPPTGYQRVKITQEEQELLQIMRDDSAYRAQFPDDAARLAAIRGGKV